jgi:hypothetical protein
MITNEQFYEKFPKFNWKFYVSNYNDLIKNKITSEEQAIIHYWKNGQYEARRTHNIILNNIDTQPIEATTILNVSNQCYVSKGLHMFEERLKRKFNLQSYQNIDTPCIFFGLYSDNDLVKIREHKGLKLLIWGGSDASTVNLHSLATINETKYLSNTIHIAISKCLHDRLKSVRIQSIYINFDLVDTTIFKPVPKNQLGNKIFIFNGQTKGRTAIYGEKYYTEVVKKLPQYTFIYSNQLNAKYEDMPDIYKQCFIMLRLTEHDGNANSVQECQSMNIPVIHNQSEYGLKWKNVNDIIKYILENIK